MLGPVERLVLAILCRFSVFSFQLKHQKKDPLHECVPCEDFCLANRVVALGNELGTVAPGNIVWSPGVGSWYFAGDGYGRLWMSVISTGTLELLNTTVVEVMGAEYQCMWNSLVSPENDPDKSTQWTSTYYKQNVLYNGKLLILF